MPQFSSDQGGQGAPGAMKNRQPTRFSPGAGNIGAKAADRALRHPGGAGQSPAARPGKSSPGGPAMGHPSFPDPQEGQPEQSDFRHVDLVGQHFNVQGLGRDIPYAVWAWLNGSHRQFAKPGEVQFDVLEDT